MTRPRHVVKFHIKNFPSVSRAIHQKNQMTRTTVMIMAKVSVMVSVTTVKFRRLVVSPPVFTFLADYLCISE